VAPGLCVGEAECFQDYRPVGNARVQILEDFDSLIGFTLGELLIGQRDASADYLFGLGTAGRNQRQSYSDQSATVYQLASAFNPHGPNFPSPFSAVK
jgi:hypothetical protein